MYTRFIKFTALAVISAMLITSCQKEVDFQDGSNGGGNGGGGGGSNNKSIIGDWKFVNMVGISNVSNSTSSMGIDAKAVAIANYTTENGSGMVKFTSTEMSYVDLAYTLTGTTDLELYLSGALISSQTQPLNAPAGPLSQSSAYQKIGTDSLYFPTNNLGSVPGAPAGNVPMGMKISWIGDTLVLKATAHIDMTQNVNGMPAVIKGVSIATMKLVK